jgi:hypothetical protein
MSKQEDAMSETKQYRANPLVSCGDEVDGSVLFNPDTDDMVVINSSGKALWEWLATPHSALEMAAFLATTYEGVSEEQAVKDAQEYIDSLLGDFLLEE